MTEQDHGEALNAGFWAEVYFPQLFPWRKISSRVLAIERACFPDNPFSKEKLRRDFTDPKNTVVILRDPREKIIGYIYAEPLEKEEKPDTCEVPPRKDSGKQTAYINNVAIDPEFHGRGLVWEMMDVLEITLSWRAWYIEGDFAVTYKFAEKVRQWYGEKKIFESSPHDSDWGLQRLIRARL